VTAIGETAKNSFLSRIYTPDEFNYTQSELATLDYNQLEKQDAIVLNELRDIPQALQTTVKSFVEKGGNLIVIPALETTPANLNALVANFGNVKISPIQPNKKLVTKISFNHPLYATVFEKKIENFQYPEVKSSFSATSTSPAVLAYDDQSPFLLSLSNLVSSVYVFTAPINKDNSNFQNSPLIVPTFYNMAAANGKTGISEIIIGDNRPLLIDVLLSKDEIVNIKNNNEKFIPVQQVLNNKVRLTFNGLPEQAGNFGVYKQNDLIKNVSFNYGRTEGNLLDANTDALSDYKTVGSVDSVYDAMLTDRTNNELWKWFVILALVFIVTELLIQKFVK
jgi:hypothetical protein